MLNIFFYLLIFLFLLNFIFIKNKIFLENPNKKHKKLINNINLPISGGIFILISFLVMADFSAQYNLIFFLVFLIGLFSDLEMLESPKLRLLLQIIVVVLYVVSSNNLITDIRIEKINFILSDYKSLSIFFTIFCFVVLINGTNFMDGVNSFVGIYYLFIMIIVTFFLKDLDYNFNNMEFLITVLLVFIIFNLFGKTILGDGGAYFVSFITGAFLISLSKNNILISPYFVVLLLWYPAYENLFSIIRKNILKIDPLKPDNNHLHQLIYFHLKKFSSYANTQTGLILSIFNLIIFLLAVNFYSETEILISIIVFNVFFYNITYFYLYNKKNSK